MNAIDAAIVDECSDEGCKVPAPPGAIILKGEKLIGGKDKAADCIFLLKTGDGFTVAIAELKAHNVDASKVEAKIQNSLDCLCASISQEKIRGFFPIIVVRSWRNGHELAQMKTKRVQFSGRAYPILRAKCGDSLQEVLRSVRT